MPSVLLKLEPRVARKNWDVDIGKTIAVGCHDELQPLVAISFINELVPRFPNEEKIS